MASIGILLFILYLPWFFTEFNLQLEPDHPQNKSSSLQDNKGKFESNRNFKRKRYSLNFKLTNFI